jgi:hydroxyacylglutathione hydrolase
MRVVTIPCRSDNYSYLVGSNGGTSVVAVDPCDTEPVLEALAANALALVGILNTHHHGDHVGGNLGLLRQYPGVPVYAHHSDRGRIPGQTHDVDEGSRVSIAGLTFETLFVPGHTRGHTAYISEGHAFVGDTMFGAGCGRLFEGTAAQLNRSLNDKLARLPDDTKVYFAHEYTASNLRFAAAMEPDNAHVKARIRHTTEVRDAGRFTTPTTIAVEKLTNPFLRIDQPAIRQRLGFPLEANADEVFAALRLAKDRFK